MVNRPRPRRTNLPCARPNPGPKSKSVLDSLEEEMASLLGRPPRSPRSNSPFPRSRVPSRATESRRGSLIRGNRLERSHRLARRTCRPRASRSLLAGVNGASAQDISINFGQGGGLTERVLQLIALLTVLSLAPSILVMVTSFTRIVVVLSLLRTALGTATAPPNAVLISLAMFLTAFVMWPTFTTAYDAGVRPLIANEITPEQAFERASDPFRAFMKRTCATRT